MSSLNLIGISGSLRAASYSTAILNSVAGMLPDQSRWSTLDIGALPHYNYDIEVSGLPESVLDARRRVAAADALILSVPEYNHGIPGVLKNALDWLSRPVRASCMQGKPVFFMTQSEGALGGVRAQAQLRETLASMLCELPPMPEIVVSFAHEKIHAGALSHESTTQFIQARLQAFLGSLARRGAVA